MNSTRDSAYPCNLGTLLCALAIMTALIPFDGISLSHSLAYAPHEQTNAMAFQNRFLPCL